MCSNVLVDGVTCAAFPVLASSGEELGAVVVPQIELAKVARRIGVESFDSQDDLVRKFADGLVSFAGRVSDAEFDSVLSEYVRLPSSYDAA